MTDVIELRPLTRVEGHGKVTVHMDGAKVDRVHLSLYESPRLFEALILNKNYKDIPEIICRICSLCSTVHRVTAILAIENALNINVSEQVKLYRELITYGGHIQSHALHLFCLVLPDFYGAAGFAELARDNRELLDMGLRIKGVGNMIQETVGGRLIHPVTLIPGGMGKPVNRDGLMKMRDAVESVKPDVQRAISLFDGSMAHFAPCKLPPPRFLAAASEDMPFLFGTELRLAEGGNFAVDEYRKLLAEKPAEDSNAKMSLMGGEPLTVGAVARLGLGMKLAPAALTAARKRQGQFSDIRANNLAQAVELIHAFERSLEIVNLLLNSDFRREPLPPEAHGPGSGSAAMEAPRGLLIHSYSIDAAGRCIGADVITPTAINQAAIERDLLILAGALEGADREELKRQLEMLVRAYDPCISCAVHIVNM